MKLNKITLNNIRSYKNDEINFPLNSTLLAGDVGAGKTTILLAIEFALFGLQPGQRGSSLLSSSENEAQIILEMEIDSNIIVIERTLARTSKGVNQDYSAISINGVKEELSVTELKTRVLELLGYPEEFVKRTNLLYRYTVYSPQEEMKEIILEDAESRLNILRYIFGIDKYRRIKENTSLVTLKMREQSRVIQGEIKDIENYKTRLLEFDKNLYSLEASLEDKIKILSDKKEARKKHELELKELQEKLKEKQKFEKEIEKASLLLANKVQQKGEQEREIKKTKNSIPELKELFNQQLYTETISEIESKKISFQEVQKDLISISEKINSLNSIKNQSLEKRERVFNIEICPTCLQNVPHTHKHNIVNEVESQISKIEKDISEIIVQINPLKIRLEAEKKAISELEARKSYLEILKLKIQEMNLSQKRIFDLSLSIESFNKDITALEEHLIMLKRSVLEFSKFDIQYSMKEQELKKAFESEKHTEIEIAEIKKEHELTMKEQERTKLELKRKEQSREQLFKLISLENWLTEEFTSLISLIEKNIMLKLRGEFSRLFNKWFSMLTTDAFYVHLDENFTPIIMQNDYELDYSFLSGGERTAVALAYRLALNQIINSIHSKIKTRDIIILDEPTDGFSEQQLDKVRDILKELQTRQLIIVSHEQKIESFVDSVIRIKKDAGYSARV